MSGWRAWGLVGLIALAPACKGLTYACIEDGECGAGGTCEAEGWCSFADDRCESGRRYAEFSGGGLGGVCVDVSPASSSGASTSDTSTSDVSTSTESGASSGEPIVGTGSTSTGSTSLVDPSSSSGTVSSSGSSGESSNPCVGWADEFDDGVIGPEWTTYGDMGPDGHVMDEADGLLHWTFAEGVVQQRGVYRVLTGPIEGVQVQTAGLSETAEAQTVLLIRDSGAPWDLFLVWGDGSVDFRIDSDSIAAAEEQGWVDVRFEDGMVVVSQSSDGVDFETLVEVEAPIDLGGLELFLYGQTWTEAPVPSEAAFERIQLCEP